jgi:chemotaxis protein MotB
MKKRRQDSEGEFLWLVSLSDLMILLFVFFVVLFSFSVTKLDAKDLNDIQEKMTGEKSSATQTLDSIQAKLLKWVVAKNLLDSIEVKQKEDALILEIKEQLLFSSGSFEIRPESLELVELIGIAMEKIPSPFRIGVEGHTDDADLRSKTVTDNWELSARRAHSVLTSLQLKPELLSRAVILGYGAMRPVAPNRDKNGDAIPDNQSRNRRVTIRIF